MQNVEQQISRSLVALLLRQVIAYSTIFFGNVLLSRWLSIEIYGIFSAAFAFQQTLLLFSDVGLGPALVQRIEEPTDSEVSSLFTIQFVLCSVLMIVVWMLSPLIVQAAGLGNSGIYLVRALALILPVIAFRSIPALLLERNLRFDIIAIAETVSLVIYQIVIISLVWCGLGIESILWALAAKYTCDLVIILYFRPWVPHISMNIGNALPYIRFGLSMQAVRFLAYVKDDLPVLVLLPWLGAASVGQWSWAISYIGIPIYFNRLLNRIMFPAYSRSQHDTEKLGNLMNMAIWLNFAIGLPILLILLLFESNIIPAIYNSSWLVATPIVNWLSLNMLSGFIVNPVFPVLYGTGKSTLALKIFSIWVLTTILGTIISFYVGQLVSLAIALSCSTLITMVILLIVIRPIVKVDLGQAVFSPLLSGFIAAIVGITANSLHTNWLIAILLTLTTYVIVIYIVSHGRIHSYASGVLIKT